uniref:F-box domain-containing protein n=1 Tax=Plectus sambesii TaxID=2011161 RepID=A0A914W3L4_9BILA
MASQRFESCGGGDGKFTELIFVVIGQFSFQSVADLEAKVARVQAENDRLRRALGDVCWQIACGQLTGKLPDNFLEQFSQLPDRPLEQVLRFLPARQVAQMRHVSRKFNQLIRKCSKTMPKKECKGSVLFKRNYSGQLIVGWVDDRGRKFTTTQFAGDNVALSELLRFIRIDGLIFFGRGLSATDEVLDQLSKAWLTIRPEVVVFECDLSQTSRNSLKAFLVKVEPSIRRLNFQNPENIADSLLSYDVIGAAGRLDGLIVLPWPWGMEFHNNNIDDETLLAMADADHMSSYFSVVGCSGITPDGIRAFVEKWMSKLVKKRKLEIGANSTGRRYGSELGYCELTFYKCANVTPATVERACGGLLEKETTEAFYGGENISLVRFAIECRASNRRMKIFFHNDSFRSHFVDEPRPGVALDLLVDDKRDSDLEYEDPTAYEADYFIGHDRIMPNGLWT